MLSVRVLLSAAVLLGSVAVGLGSAGETPNGVHLSLTETPNTMRAMWSLPSTTATSSLVGYCMFGHSADSLTTKSTVGAAYTYTAGGFSGSLFDVVMENLADDAVYFYQCGSDNVGFSAVFRFFTPPSRTTATINAVVWGDMGV